jgi:nitrite reductase (NADH) small subunit
MTVLTTLTWVPMCPLRILQPERGVAGLLPDGAQVAVFRTHDGALYALSNLDPFSGAAVLSRGIVGDRGGVATVTSPMHKQAFALATGLCLDDPDVRVPVFMARASDGMVEVAFSGRPGP